MGYRGLKGQCFMCGTEENCRVLDCIGRREFAGQIWLCAPEKVSICAAFLGGEVVEIGARLRF